MGKRLDLAGWHEIKELFDVSAQVVSDMTSHPRFPAPVARLANGPVWLLADVQLWAMGRRAGVKRPVEKVTARRPRVTPTIVGPAEAATLLHVSPRRLHQLRQYDHFPKPVALAMGPVWDASELVAWNEDRPPRKAPKAKAKAAVGG